MDTGLKTIEPLNLASVIPLLREIGNLKRIRAANLPSSFAARLFERAWTAIIAGAAPETVAAKTTADAIIAANLGAIDRPILQNAGLSEAEINTILERSFDAAASPLDENLRAELRIAAITADDVPSAQLPQFVKNLSVQPRSGATKTGAPKLIFDAPENHAEHCIVVAIYGVLLAPFFKADAETVFLAALAHHFHNAFLPDSGFAGEKALGEFLPRIFTSFREKCLAEVPENLRERIRAILALIETADAPEAKAFHAADVVDRVLQMRHHAGANEFNLKYAMEEMELVHAGAVQTFHYEILRAADLI